MSHVSYGLAPRKATEDLFEYSVVKIIGAAGVELLDGAVATDFAWGVCQRAIAAGFPCEIETRIGFTTRVVASAAFAAGVKLKVGSGADAGKVLTQTAATFLVGIALEEATAAGAIVKMRTVFDEVVSTP